MKVPPRSPGKTSTRPDPRPPPTHGCNVVELERVDVLDPPPPWALSAPAPTSRPLIWSNRSHSKVRTTSSAPKRTGSALLAGRSKLAAVAADTAGDGIRHETMARGGVYGGTIRPLRAS